MLGFYKQRYTESKVVNKNLQLVRIDLLCVQGKGLSLRGGWGGVGGGSDALQTPSSMGQHSLRAPPTLSLKPYYFGVCE